jgi:hypothetical protein
MDVSGRVIRRFDLWRTSADGSGREKRGLMNRLRIRSLSSVLAINVQHCIYVEPGMGDGWSR